MAGQTKETGNDAIEEILMMLMQNRDQLSGMIETFKGLLETGAFEQLLDLLGKFLPSNLEYLSKLVSSYNMKIGLYKTLNIIPALFAALSDEGTSDIIKALAFDAQNISEAMIDGSRNPQKLTLMKLLALGRDPEFTAGATALINMITELGRALGRIRE